MKVKENLIESKGELHVVDNRPTCPSCGNKEMNFYLTKIKSHKCSACKTVKKTFNNMMFSKPIKSKEL